MLNEVSDTVDHLFRKEYGKLVSLLTSKFGTRHIDQIEDSVQDALYKAMTQWGIKDKPSNPSKWLYRVAHNAIIDTLRRANKSEEFHPYHLNNKVAEQEFDSANELNDEQLQMIFACCHPAMNETEQLLLSLKLLCGFSNKEISRALFKEPEAVKRAITRAKAKFKSEIGELVIPQGNELTERLNAVLKVIYLLFNSGYTALEGEELLKKDVCDDAIRLAGMLYNHEECNSSQTKALLALMCFNFSRFDARIDKDQNMLTLDKQDRQKWDTDLIQLGLRFINEANQGETTSQLQLEAAIAREYAIAPSFKQTNWRVILALYDFMLVHYSSVVIQLNRLVVIDQLYGTKRAYDGLQKLKSKSLSKNYLYYSIKGDFEKKLNIEDYKHSLTQAIGLTQNQKEKDFLRKKL